MVSSGLHAVGYEHIWIDDGWAMPRDPVTHKPGVDAKIFPSGMRNLSDYVHAKGLKFGICTCTSRCDTLPAALQRGLHSVHPPHRREMHSRDVHLAWVAVHVYWRRFC